MQRDFCYCFVAFKPLDIRRRWAGQVKIKWKDRWKRETAVVALQLNHRTDVVCNELGPFGYFCVLTETCCSSPKVSVSSLLASNWWAVAGSLDAIAFSYVLGPFSRCVPGRAPSCLASFGFICFSLPNPLLSFKILNRFVADFHVRRPFLDPLWRQSHKRASERERERDISYRRESNEEADKAGITRIRLLFAVAIVIIVDPPAPFPAIVSPLLAVAILGNM